LQKDLDRLGERVAESEMEINPSKCKAVCFMKTCVTDPLNYTLGDELFPKASSCKFLGIILRSDLNWANHVEYMVKQTWKALHFLLCILKKGKSSTKSLAYITLVRPILEYGAACWDLHWEKQIQALDRVQRKGANLHII